MTLLDTKHQCSALGHVMTAVLRAPLVQATSSPPTSPEWAEKALLRFHSTAVQRSLKCSRPLDQVSKTLDFVKALYNEILQINSQTIKSWQYAAFPMMHTIVIWVCQQGLDITFFDVSGKYSPERSAKSIFRSAPAYSLSGRSKEVSTSQTPGNILYLVSTKLWIIAFHGT